MFIKFKMLANAVRCLYARLKALTERRNWTKLNGHGLVFDKLTNKQTVMHYSRHRLTASLITWLHCDRRQPMTNELAHWSVSQKLNRVSSVQFSHVARYALFDVSVFDFKQQ